MCSCHSILILQSTRVDRERRRCSVADRRPRLHYAPPAHGLIADWYRSHAERKYSNSTSGAPSVRCRRGRLRSQPCRSSSLNQVTTIKQWRHFIRLACYRKNYNLKECKGRKGGPIVVPVGSIEVQSNFTLRQRLHRRTISRRTASVARCRRETRTPKYARNLHADAPFRYNTGSTSFRLYLCLNDHLSL